jgi:hypothetical protein
VEGGEEETMATEGITEGVGEGVTLLIDTGDHHLAGDQDHLIISAVDPVLRLTVVTDHAVHLTDVHPVQDDTGPRQAQGIHPKETTEE